MSWSVIGVSFRFDNDSGRIRENLRVTMDKKYTIGIIHPICCYTNATEAIRHIQQVLM